MQDQVDALQQTGVRAAFLNSSLDAAAACEIERQLREDQLDLLYVAPERLLNPRFLACSNCSRADRASPCSPSTRRIASRNGGTTSAPSTSSSVLHNAGRTYRASR
jgi:hypothetical protein